MPYNVIHRPVSVIIRINSLRVNIADIYGHFNVVLEFHWAGHRRKGIFFLHRVNLEFFIILKNTPHEHWTKLDRKKMLGPISLHVSDVVGI